MCFGEERVGGVGGREGGLIGNGGGVDGWWGKKGVWWLKKRIEGIGDCWGVVFPQFLDLIQSPR